MLSTNPPGIDLSLLWLCYHNGYIYLNIYIINTFVNEMCPVLASLPFLILFLVIYGINWVLRKRKHPPDGKAVLITGMNVSHLLTLCLLVSSADNLSKRFGPRSGQTFCRA